MELYNFIDESDFQSFNSDVPCVFTAYIKDSISKNEYDFFFQMFLRSLLLTNRHNEMNVFIILNDGSLSLIKSSFRLMFDLLKDSKIHFYLIRSELFERYLNNMKIGSGFSKAIVFRLFLPFMFSNIDRFLWLDIDMIICFSLLYFFNMDNSNYSFMGYRDIDDNRKIPFLNSGVLIVNSRRIRDRYRTLKNVLDFYIYKDCETDQIFIYKDKDYLTMSDITYNYPGIYSRYVHPFINNPFIVDRLAKLAKDAKIIHFYPKNEYTKSPKIYNILLDNNDICKQVYY